VKARFTGFAPLAIVGDFVISFVTSTGWKFWWKYKEQTSSPYQYLTLIEKGGASLVSPPAVARE
jgi:hypothetical protein